jgi:ribosome-binding factor A
MSQRIARVNELVKRELSMVLERHYRFEGVVITVHDVVTTPDLRQCFAYIGILGTARDPQAIIDKLTKERGNIQRELHKRVILLQIPSRMKPRPPIQRTDPRACFFRAKWVFLIPRRRISAKNGGL